MDRQPLSIAEAGQLQGTRALRRLGCISSHRPGISRYRVYQQTVLPLEAWCGEKCQEWIQDCLLKGLK